MDPHSTLSQFNHRKPKAGPQSQRFVEKMPKSVVAGKKQSISDSLLVHRPIATNSRVKQDEKYRKDMYLAFVNNALLQKRIGVTEPFDELVNQFNPKRSPSESAPQLVQLRLWILALSHVVSRLERSHSALVEAIVNMPWTTLDTATVKSYTVFLGMLLSARPEYLSLVLEKVAHGFTYQSGIYALDVNTPECSSTPLTRRIIYDRIHFLLRHLLTLIPTLPSTLQPLLVRHFPHKRQNQIAQSTYIRNILRVSSYCPELADKILATIVDRAIQIDVEIQVEMEELEEVAPPDQDLFEIDPFDTLLGQEGDSDSDSEGSDDNGDNFSDLSSDAGDMDDSAHLPELPTNIKHIQEMAQKLDAILTLIFEHFHRNHVASTSSTLQSDSHSSSPPDLPPLPPLTPRLGDLNSVSYLSSPIESFSSPSPIPPLELTSISVTPPAPSPSAALHAQFHALLSIFDRTILRTFKSRYTQFLLFWYTSLDPEFADVFQGMLVDRALFHRSPHEILNTPSSNHMMDSTPAVTRAAAASYIGSFVSRATFVDRLGTRNVVGVLCEFLRAHLEAMEEAQHFEFGIESASQEENTVFYAVTQAVFLIFCFRWRDLLEDEAEAEGDGVALGLVAAGKVGKRWMPELRILQRVVMSCFNPLKVCSQNVVMQFARIAQATDFVYCYSVLEANRRSDYCSSSSISPSRSQMRNDSVHHDIFHGPMDAELNSFFPFDPYRLPRSNVYIQGVYREWSSVAIDDNEDNEDEEDEDDEEIPDGSFGIRSSGYLAIPRKEAEDDMGLGASLDAMSISPARPGHLSG